MTEGERFILKLEAKRVAKVRYGRAVLRIARWGDLHDSPLGQAITQFKAGEITAEDVCWQLARDRVESHSPSFDWCRADLDRLLPLVTGASTEPELPSGDPQAVAELLVKTQAEEAERMRKIHENFSRQMGKITGIVDQNRNLLSQVAKINGITQGLTAFQNLSHTRTYSIASEFADVIRQRAKIADFSGLGRIHDQVRGLGADWMRTVGLQKSLTDQIKMTGYVRPPWLDQIPDLNRWLKGFDFTSVIERMRRALPANWRELKKEEMEQVVELMEKEGLSLAWAPRVEILREILGAQNHEERCEILCEKSAEIIEDIEAALEIVTRDDLVLIKSEWPKVIGPYRDGWYEGAQSYSATLIGEIAHGPLEWKNFGPVRKSFRGRKPMEEGMNSFALCAVGTAWVRVIDKFDDAGDGFNRNLTQHRIGFHNQPNCLMAMLLLAGLLVEIQRYLNAEDKRRETDEGLDEAA